MVDNNVKKWKIYAYINQINGKIYIGQTCRTLKERAGKDGNLYMQCKRFGYAIQKYGWDNFKPIIILENLTREYANICEMELIKKYDTTNPDKGYNISLGGNDNTFTAIDITGQRFGKLVAIELVENDKVGRYWLCECDCGNLSVVRQDHLRNGTTKACIKCGCKTKKVIPNDIEECNNKIKVLMANGYYFYTDKDTYNLIKNDRWCFEKVNNRIVNTKTSKNILKVLFPHLKRNIAIKYVDYKDKNRFNLCKDNLFIKTVKDIAYDEWIQYLHDNNNIIFMGTSYKNKWKNKDTGKLFYTYMDALHDLDQEVIND